MKLKAPAIEIPTDDPFRNDLLGHKESAKALTELVKSTEDPLVICIDGPWGGGKTTFVKMWQQHLINSGFPTLYFNAWENDFSDSALVSLIGELETGIEGLALKDGEKKKAKSHLKMMKKAGVAFFKKAAPTAIRIATSGVIDLSAAAEEAISQFGEKVVQEQIENYEAAKKTIKGFKEELTSFAEQVTAGAKDKERLPLVILIDELDRCRPNYAVELLEKAKHLFNVPMVVFVLAADKEQLGHSIRSIYGQGMDVNGYLRRFIDLDYVLPRPQKGRFCKAQFERFGLRDFFNQRKGHESRYEFEEIQELFSELFSILRFTLREQEHCFMQLSLAIRTTPPNVKLYPLLLGTLIILKIKNPDLFKKFISGRSDPSEILDYFRAQPGSEEFLNDNYGITLEAYLTMCHLDESKRDELSRYQQVVDSPKSSESEKQRATAIIELLRTREFKHSYGILDYLVKKIDMVSHFER